MNTKLIARVSIALIAFAAPMLALAQSPNNGFTITQQNTGGTAGFFFSPLGSVGAGGGCTSNICAVAQNILFLINNVLVPVLFAIAFIVFLFGIARAYIFSGGDPERVKQGHQLLLWGIIAFVVMVSIWGLVNVVANTFGLYGAPALRPPTSYPF
jgi:hypothetical protein